MLLRLVSHPPSPAVLSSCEVLEERERGERSDDDITKSHPSSSTRGGRGGGGGGKKKSFSIILFVGRRRRKRSVCNRISLSLSSSSSLSSHRASQILVPRVFLHRVQCFGARGRMWHRFSKFSYLLFLLLLLVFKCVPMDCGPDFCF